MEPLIFELKEEGRKDTKISVEWYGTEKQNPAVRLTITRDTSEDKTYGTQSIWLTKDQAGDLAKILQDF